MSATTDAIQAGTGLAGLAISVLALRESRLQRLENRQPIVTSPRPATPELRRAPVPPTGSVFMPPGDQVASRPGTAATPPDRAAVPQVTTGTLREPVGPAWSSGPWMAMLVGGALTTLLLLATANEAVQVAVSSLLLVTVGAVAWVLRARRFEGPSTNYVLGALVGGSATFSAVGLLLLLLGG